MNAYEYTYSPEAQPILTKTEQSDELAPTHANPPQHTASPALPLALKRLEGGNLPASALLQLQRTHGNRYVQRLIARQGSGGAPEVTPEVERNILASRGLGQPLDLGVQRQMGAALGSDFSGVRVHTDQRADGLNQSLSARAFTTGSDIYFRQGAYQPGSSSGRELIAHELTHVVQQSGGAVQTKLTVNPPGDRYEQEADQVARAVVHQEQAATPIQRASEDDQMQAKLNAGGIQRAEEDDQVQAQFDDTGLQRQPEEEQKDN
jgi:hypothetical protein